MDVQEVTMVSEPTDRLTPAPATHGKLGVYHCGVTREGFIAVAGDPRAIEDGREILFERTRIKARRRGSDCRFTRVA